jgi:hypothetical protein
VCPPRIEVIDHELHHKVLGLVEGRQDEAAGAHAEHSDLAVENFFEAQFDVEALRYLKIFCGNEGSGSLSAAWNVGHRITSFRTHQGRGIARRILHLGAHCGC